MRTLLYFILKDVVTARLAQARLGDLANTSALIVGPWFSQRDNQPVDGLPSIDVGQTTYREELAISGIFVGAIIAALAVLRYGVSVGTSATAIAYVGAMTLGAMSGWWVGGLVGTRISRLGLRRQKAQMTPDQLLMISSCDSNSKESTKQLIHELGGVAIDEHNDLMPRIRWA
ncbi:MULTISPECIES: hypothetical protein [Cupriavidus]|jgi:hypothetical protein|uniref:Uncharacterized protein n=1 Tax=Cupriavidus metallidurans TaxID=119219 RepID=A0A482IYV0_9BURK|nr:MULTISPECIES: hypothetical protein [Cupriavidus]KWR85541.1 hypothetical protein RN01_03995 [Cupriavidus sp. SHE]QBP13116.1 hypothetical protein DDF84_026100 [Cupriavidus metallidurans]QWC90900.1 hypothetical protein KB891_25665 [Cupriavidus metallidurans]